MYRGSGIIELLLLLVLGVDSSFSSDFGGEGGNRRVVSGNSVPSFFVCATVNGGGSGMATCSEDMIRCGTDSD